MKKLIMAVIAIFAYVLAADSAMAASPATGTLPVTATVAKSCKVTSPGSIAFGPYDQFAGAPLNADGTLVFRCVTGTNYTVTIVRTNNMDDGSGNLLPYTISDITNGGAAWVAVAGVGAGAGFDDTMTIYGQIPAGVVDIPEGNYSENAVITISY